VRVNKRRAQLALQSPDQFAQRWRGHVQTLGGPAEMKLRGYRDERF
jgi:hypothetical protein